MSDSVRRGEIVPLPEEEGFQLPANPFEPTRGIFLTWDLSDDGGRSRLAKCQRPADYPMIDNVGKVVQCEHICCHLAQRVNEETGEVTLGMRTVLVDTDGKTWSSMSPYVMRSIGNLVSCYGDPPWSRGVPVAIVLCESRKRRKFLMIEPVG